MVAVAYNTLQVVCISLFYYGKPLSLMAHPISAAGPQLEQPETASSAVAHTLHTFFPIHTQYIYVPHSVHLLDPVCITDSYKG